MLNLEGKVAIVKSTTFFDRFNLVLITKETAQTITVRHWNDRTSNWDIGNRRNDKHIVKIIADDVATITPQQLNKLSSQIASAYGEMDRRVRAAKKSMFDTVEGLKL